MEKSTAERALLKRVTNASLPPPEVPWTAFTTGCVAEEIIRNSVSAATEDPRFSKVEGAELDNLDYTIDVLSPPEPVKNLKELDHKKYGVIVVSGHRRGLLLPDLEGVDSVEHQVIIAKQKAGIGMSEPVQLFRFEVRRHT